MPISVFLRQYLYFCTRNCVSICTGCGFREVLHASQRVCFIYIEWLGYSGSYEAHAICVPI